MLKALVVVTWFGNTEVCSSCLCCPQYAGWLFTCEGVIQTVGLSRSESCPERSLKNCMQGPSMNERKFPTAFPLKHQKKDLVLACDLGKEVNASMPVAGAAASLYSKVSSICNQGPAFDWTPQTCGLTRAGTSRQMLALRSMSLVKYFCVVACQGLALLLLLLLLLLRCPQWCA